jgi:hypothetical protein
VPCSEAAANTVIDLAVLADALAAAEDAALAPADAALAPADAAPAAALAALDVAELTGLPLEPQPASAPTASPATVKLEMTVNRRNVTSVVSTSHVTTTQSDKAHAPGPARRELPI